MNEMSKRVPRATYRVQLNKDFGFDDLARIVPYLARLGISHVYCSPYLRARPGSVHGYDIVSHTELNPELGDDAAFRRMVAALHQYGLGQILDFVPNHMGVGGADNHLWLDLLEWGQASSFASWFDVDWWPDRRYLQGKVLVPFLGDQYGAVLQAGDLRIKFDAEEGSLAVWAYGSHKLPICPLNYGAVLGNGHPDLERASDSFAHLSTSAPNIGLRANELKARLAAVVKRSGEAADALIYALADFEGQLGDLKSWERLDALIQDQHWRPAYFRAAADDINYRRFFNINELAGLRMELPEVFEHTHSLVFELIEKGILDGLRLDHIDGLFDPKGYCLRLRERSPRPIYLVVEKILASQERLRADWQVDGTTGYEFVNLVNGLLLDQTGEQRLSEFYADFTGNRARFDRIVREAKLEIMENEMASELNVLAREAARVARSNPLTADFTNHVLLRALKEIVAAFPVYRTYVDEDASPTEDDRRHIDFAVAQARRHGGALDDSVFEFLRKLLSCDLVAQPRSGFSRHAVARVAMRAQQYSGPVMAKGLEDTAFYRYNRLLALNEVGGNPAHFTGSVNEFHEANLLRLKSFPHTMLSTATHDTKRGEDARARLAVLSELPEEWIENVKSWSSMLRVISKGSRDLPEREDEYVFYQTLLGAWPPELSMDTPNENAIDAFRVRVEGAIIKSLRESKLRTTWTAPNKTYENVILDFIRRAFKPVQRNEFLQSFFTFQQHAAALGARNSIIQTVLKLTAPGVPDIYQGAELWDFSMVDPDNRRPVDYDKRSIALEHSTDENQGDGRIALLMENWRGGHIKMKVVSDLLALRGRCPDLFASGSYKRIETLGSDSDRICAFARSLGRQCVIVAVSLGWRYDQRTGWPDLKFDFEGTSSWKDLFTGQRASSFNGQICASALFDKLPVALFAESRI
jgi:(1->4)-alpha-D-glucan 1-alpha-D-glucosylmutase